MDEKEKQNWDEHKKKMKQMREQRRELFGDVVIKELEGLGYRIREMSPFQFRINDRLDIYPSNKRYHDIREFKRGDIRGTTFVGFVKQYLPL